MNPFSLKPFFSSYLTGIVFFLSTITAGYGVMPPEHYSAQARQSKIKAVAVVKDISILSQTKQDTQKQVFFELIKGFEKNIPAQFSGTCYSIDQPWQQPLAGGKLFYYPVKGQKVLVTVFSDSGLITSYTPFDAVLENEINSNGLQNIVFKLGKAVIDTDTADWFLFYLEDKPAGYLKIKTHHDPNLTGSADLEQSFLIGELDGDRTVFRILTRFRENDTFTLEWISIQSAAYSSDKIRTIPLREYSFKPSGKSVTEPGILVKNEDSRYNISVTDRTTTDFLLFLLIQTLPFEKNKPFQIDLVETLELNFKKNIQLEYMGPDKSKQNLHLFKEYGAGEAFYWLDDNHNLVEAQWDTDKRFVKGDEAQAMTILQ